MTATVAAIACGWNLVTDHSVRFNSHRTGRGFYRLPPLPIMYDKTTGKEMSVKDREDWYRSEHWGEESDIPTRFEEADGIWGEVFTAVEKDEINLARERLLRFVELTEHPLDVSEDEKTQLQNKRNAARDMLDSMSALRQGSSPRAVGEYLKKRLTLGYASENGAEPSTTDKNLEDNWAYFRAAKLHTAGDKQASLELFTLHTTRYPRSEKNEAALYMVARITMEQSHSFVSTGCGIEGKGKWGEPIDPSTVEDVSKCHDANWQAAIDAFKRVMERHPNGRYYNDARGWLAHLYRRGGERAKALAEYYRLLGHPTDWAARLEAKKSLQMIGHEYDDATLDSAEALIADDVNAAMAYAYHRIYNHAIDLTYVERDRWCCVGENRWEEERDEKKRVIDANNAGKHELERVAHFATSMMKRHPNAPVSGGFVLRLAEAQLELQNFKEARVIATKALGSRAPGELRAEALWVKGSAEHQLKDLASAKSTLEELVSAFPKSRLTAGARRLLALTAEDRGDLESALEHYLALDYRYDVAYYVDVFLPTDRLAEFVANRPNLPEHNQLLYALGVRYMRDKRWSEARTTLMGVQTVAVSSQYNFDNEANKPFPKEPEWSEKQLPLIKNSWVMLDLKTIDVLEQMERLIENAPDDGSKAEAIYQMASYLFEADDLLFYNPAAWKGSRADLLYNLQFGSQMRFPEESQVIFDHSQQHETLSRAIPVYLDTANRFPNTRAAKDALYSAAVAQERLSNINNYWREIYDRNLFAGPRLLSYDDVKSAYPSYQLPRGTSAWKPSTRTVNGGPGWAALPKPAPRETKEQKVKRLLREATTSLSEKFLPKIESKVDASVEWYRSAAESAIYGTLSGIGLWVIALIGVGLHTRRRVRHAVGKNEEPHGTDSRVDKFLG